MCGWGYRDHRCFIIIRIMSAIHLIRTPTKNSHGVEDFISTWMLKNTIVVVAVIVEAFYAFF
jgi:hypothetical protein